MPRGTKIVLPAPMSLKEWARDFDNEASKMEKEAKYRLGMAAVYREVAAILRTKNQGQGQDGNRAA